MPVNKEMIPRVAGMGRALEGAGMGHVPQVAGTGRALDSVFGYNESVQDSLIWQSRNQEEEEEEEEEEELKAFSPYRNPSLKSLIFFLNVEFMTLFMKVK